MALRPTAFSRHHFLRYVPSICIASFPLCGRSGLRSPLEVEQCIIKALAKDPQERFATVQDFAWALQEASRRAIDAYIFTSLQRHLQEPLDFNTNQAPSTFLNARSSRVAHLDQYDTIRLKAILKTSSLSNANQDGPTCLNARLAPIQAAVRITYLCKREVPG